MNTIWERGHRTRHWACAMLAAILLTACGGSGGGSDNTPEASNQPPTSEPTNPGTDNPVNLPSELPVTYTTQYSIGPGVPATAKNLVSKMTGADGDSSLVDGGAAISNSSVYPFIAALTADNHIVLASVEAGASVELNEVSTAITLVRILMGELPDISEALLFTSIASQPSTKDLADAVYSAWAQGKVPSQDAQILLGANKIAAQVMKDFASSANAATANKVSQALTMEANRNLPLKILSLPIGNVYLTGGLVNIYNSTPIAWSAKSSTYDGAPILADSKDSVLLPSAGVKEWALAPLLTSLPWSGETVPNDGDRAFYVTILQDTASRRTNIIELLSTIIKMAADIAPLNDAGTCTAELVEALFNDKLAAMINDATSKTTTEFFAAAGKDAAKLLVNLNNGAPRLCPGSEWVSRKTRLLQRLPSVASRLNAVGEVIETAISAGEAATLAGRSYWLVKNWETSQDIHVCVADNKIDNCASSYEFPEDLTLIEGANHIPLVNAYDVDGKRTGLPSSVRFSTDSNAFTVDQTTGEITAGNNPGFGRIYAKDISTNSKGEAVVSVESGAVSPASQTLTIPQTGTASIVGSEGKPIITDGVSFSWFTLTAGVIELFPAVNGTGVLFAAKNDGTTDLLVNNGVSGRTLKSTVKVDTSGMLGDTITVARRYPTVSTLEGVAWTPASMSITAVTGNADEIVFKGGPSNNIYAKVNVEANDIEFLLVEPSLYLTSSSVFDGFVISGFKQAVKSAVVQSNQTGISVVVDHTETEVRLKLSGSYSSNTSFRVHVEF